MFIVLSALMFGQSRSYGLICREESGSNNILVRSDNHFFIKRRSGDEIKSLEQLKQIIKKCWKTINDDKKLCSKLMNTIPSRMKRLIDARGYQT